MPDSPVSNAAPSDWRKLSEKTIADCRVFRVSEKRFRHPVRETEGDFYVLESTDWVNVIALTPDYKVVLVNQFRFGVERLSWEIPGGVMDPGEDPIAAGLRELQEETGYTATKARLLGSIHPNPAIQSNRCHFVLAEGARKTAGLEWDAHEELEMKIEPIDEVYAMVQRGEIFHSLVLNALLFFYPEWLKLQVRRRG